MNTLIDRLFPEDKAVYVKRLLEDDSSRFLLEKEIAKMLLRDEDVVGVEPLAQIVVTVSMSTFASSKEECYDVAFILYWGIDKTDILPMITQHHGKELAYRCLISRSLFADRLEERRKRHGAPSGDFYKQMGIMSFNQIGMPDIGAHFDKWEGFIGEVFA